MKRLIVFDVSSFIFRAFFAIRPLHAPDGTPVNSIYGVLNMIVKILKDYKPTHVLIARDTKEGSFRSDIFPEYKANRSEPPEELVPQFALIEKLIDLLNWPQIKMPGYEADDIIGSAVTQYASDFDEIFIATGDKDLMQFVNSKVKILDSMKDVVYGENEVKEKMGVWPNQIVDYLSLLGDSSDNIPGVKGIGAKGAQKLIEEYENLENILLHKNEISNKRTMNALLENEDKAHLSKKLISIVTDLALNKKTDDLELHFNVSNELIAFLQELGFQSTINKLKDFTEKGNEQKNRSNVKFIAANASELSSLIETVERMSYLPHASIGFSMSFRCAGENILVSANEIEREKCLLNILTREIELITWESKPLFKLASKMKLEIKAKIFDVSVMHFTANPATKNTFEFAVQEYLGNLVDSSSVESEALIAERVECLERLFLALINQLNDLNLYSIYQDIEKPLTQVLAKMEFEGVKLDVDFYQKLELDFSKQLEKLDIEIEKIAGEKINLRSPKQLSELLFERLNLPVIKKTKTGFSTDSEVLTELAAQKAHPIADLLLQYRELDKLLSTYIKALPKLVDYNSSRLHTTFQQTNAATGRLSSDHPNLQNIPIRTENGRLLRKGFVAEKGYCLVSADYSQVELRILAHCSEDPIMLDTFARDLDIHTQTAAEIFNIPLDKVTKAQRSSAKAINFGLMYGQSSFGLSKALGISRAEAKDYITFYFERFSQVKAYLDSLRERCEKLGYAETLFGRKRFLPDINSKNRTVKAMAERVAINSPIQGTAADIIKMAMIKVDKRLKRENLEAKLILQVHDELIIEAPNGEVETIKDLLKQEMESAAQLKVKLQVDVSAGENWYDLK